MICFRCNIDNKENHMNDYQLIGYVEGNIFSVIIFGIMLLTDLVDVDRQEKQIKFDNVLIAFIMYFLTDSLWAFFMAGRLPNNRLVAGTIDFLIYLFNVLITYSWLSYVMALEEAPHRNRPINKFAVLFPFIVSTIMMVITYVIAPEKLLDKDLNTTGLYNIYLVTVSYIYIVAVIIYALRKAKTEENPIEKRRHLFVAGFPLLVVAGGMAQMLIYQYIPIYCFSCVILMLLFFIQMMRRQISVDPLTGLNNRGQLMRYVSQRSNMYQEDRKTFVVMIDINDFKAINDTYGHAEGDKALIVVADSLKKVASRNNVPLFIGRYGGDEFIIIIHPVNDLQLEPYVEEVRKEIAAECKAKETAYTVSIGCGYEELQKENDSFQKCLARADEKLYKDKRYQKSLMKTE